MSQRQTPMNRADDMFDANYLSDITTPQETVVEERELHRYCDDGGPAGDL